MRAELASPHDPLVVPTFAVIRDCRARRARESAKSTPVGLSPPKWIRGGTRRLRA